MVIVIVALQPLHQVRVLAGGVGATIRMAACGAARDDAHQISNKTQTSGEVSVFRRTHRRLNLDG